MKSPLLASLITTVAVLATGCTAGQAAQEPTVRAPANLVITSPRICAAAEVYVEAIADDYAQRAAIANAAINRINAHGVDCADQVAFILTENFSAPRWQASLDVADAVLARAYGLPDDCARANTVTDAGTELAQGASCVISGLAFVEVR